MSIQHFVNIKVNAIYAKENIRAILENGSKKGMKYKDDSSGQHVNLGVDQAADTIINAFESNAEYGPLVSVIIEENDCAAILSFYKSDEGYLEMHFGGFGSPIRKDFNGNMRFIDFDHYIRMALDLCKDFAIVKLETESF